ncbi:rab-GTPase-TBC domain-containing protein [Lactarius akahatsu]|uniref:Rab-GTPase-TBC domain-containing protein n=1 Tax=Lactarius akahatsu TaxID=416441 RepID=A0AAD4L8W8_9AGAM|nr:rab-GTPase-TBC domain-containing protein [Lactarius akahatsu]
MDTDFELVRPALSRPRVSEDSSANGKSSGSEGRPSFLRIDSPATSLTSGGASDTRSPVSTSASIVPPPSPGATTLTTVIPAATVEAHRALELKWVAVMAVTPSAVARKNKKIRRLLQEGVPASVRYQVWAHLADSRAKRIEGLYSQLGERGRVPAFADIQRDAQDCFAGDKRLAQPNGPLVSLLQSYLTMVPDIRYSKGLAFIAGQLLLQSPEEDAFWIFISLMDTHLRPYFSSNSVQLDIDASLFAKAVESCRSPGREEAVRRHGHRAHPRLSTVVHLALRRGASYGVFSESVGYFPERRRGFPLPHRARTRDMLPSHAARHPHRGGRARRPRAPTALPPLVLAQRAHRALKLVPHQGRRHPQAARQARGARSSARRRRVSRMPCGTGAAAAPGMGLLRWPSRYPAKVDHVLYLPRVFFLFSYIFMSFML